MNIFFSTTKYTLITCINLIITKYKDQENIIIICDLYSTVYDDYMRAKYILKNIHIYYDNPNTFYIDDIEEVGMLSKYKKYIIQVKRFLYYRSKYSHILKNIECEKFFAPGFFCYSEIVFFLLKNKNQNIKFYLYDEGTSSYIFNLNIKENLSKKLKFILSIINKTNYNKGHKVDKKFLYLPSLFLFEKSNNLQALDKISEGNYKLLTDIFLYSNNRYSQRYIYLEQWFNKEVQIYEEKLLEHISLSLKDDFLFKTHPSSLRKSNLECIYDSTPWEIICMNMEIESKVLITINSTACMTPKILFDKEPVIIFLHDLFPCIDNYESMNNLIKKFTLIYDNKDRIFLPKNIDELIDILAKIK